MAKSLELTFVTDSGKLSRLSIDNPKEPVDPAAVKLAMEQIIAADVFQTMNGTLASAKEARVIERNVTAYELV
ncbi:DUF2922 domain-containing protein [Bacillus sp. JJ1503]|uniref:DUF2922 domain-containing protein n=1 Tax=Bacillus sp. JJ1503 TaxID=3122956 RepID=UPI002FFFB935